MGIYTYIIIVPIVGAYILVYGREVRKEGVPRYSTYPLGKLYTKKERAWGRVEHSNQLDFWQLGHQLLWGFALENIWRYIYR